MRKHKWIQYIIGFCFFGICLFCILYKDVVTVVEQRIAKKEINSWVSENLLESNTLQYDVDIRFHLPSAYSEKEYELIYLSSADMSVKVDKINKTAEFYNIKLKYNRDYDGKNYKNISDSYYLKKDEKNVYLYIPDENGYFIKTVENELLSEALEGILFYDNNNLLNIQSAFYNTSNDYSSDYHYYRNGNVDCSFLYSVFSEELPYNSDIIVSTELIKGDYYPQGDPRFIIGANDIQEIFYVFAAMLNDSEWINPIEAEQIKLETRITVTFPVNFDDEVEIELPYIGM